MHTVSFSLRPKTERVTQLCRAPFPETLFYPLSRVFRRSGSVVAVLRCPRRRLRSHVRRPRAAQRSGSPLRRSSGLEARAREKRKTTTVVGEWEKKEGVLLSFGLCRISQLLPRGLGAQSLFIDASRARRKGFFCQRPGRLRRSTGERRKRRISIVVISKRDKGQNETRDGLPEDIVSSIITEKRLATLTYSTNEPVVVISFSH